MWCGRFGGGAVLGLALAAGVSSAEGLEPLPWDEAYRLAEDTLANMTEPVIEVSGLCPRYGVANGLLLQHLGHLHQGAPLYGAGGYFLFFEPRCDGQYDTAPRWILSQTRPTDKDGGLNEGHRCGEAHISVTHAERRGPRLGSHSWTMSCGPGGKVQEVLVTLRSVLRGEKYTLLRGVGWVNQGLQRWYYVGNTIPIPRLGIPSLNMQDAASGFRTIWSELVGTVTVMPSMLSMAATWNASAVREYGRVLGREFRGKGANVILGPAVNVHRVARMGRNFEYLSGEDPVLGSVLAKAYIEGVQSEGVIAVVKHWIFHEQETNRGRMSAEVDNKTAWELYYPPFQAAVDAGACAVMCSYNKVRGEFSCSAGKELDLLHQRMGFKGFVMSDWWANHFVSVKDGLDQEMPGSYASFTVEHLDKLPSEIVDRAAKRILAAMFRLRLPSTTTCSPPHCEDLMRRDVTTPEHRSFARRAAAESIVLLKNDDATLPLRRGARIAVVGAAAAAQSFDPNGAGQGGGGDWATGDYYSGGGSGHMAGHAVTVIAGIRDQSAANDVHIDASLNDDVDQALKVARHVDVALVVVGTTSGEGRDRVDLTLDGKADQLIDAVAKVARKTVVLVMAPGAVLMPWRHRVDSIAILFLGGQETGHAWADVVFGSHMPTGRLPIMLPETEADTIKPTLSLHVPYTEGLATSYRNTKFRSAFPFGHGLTYTSFELSEPGVSDCSFIQNCRWRLSGGVRNTGSRAGSTVIQVYLQFHEAAGQPAPVLKSFQRTATIDPGAACEYTIDLYTNDTLYWDLEKDDWEQAPRGILAHIGQSQRDVAHSVRLCPDRNCLPLLSSHERSTTVGGFVVSSCTGFLLICASLHLATRQYRKQQGQAAANVPAAGETTEALLA